MHVRAAHAQRPRWRARRAQLRASGQARSSSERAGSSAGRGEVLEQRPAQPGTARLLQIDQQLGHTGSGADEACDAHTLARNGVDGYQRLVVVVVVVVVDERQLVELALAELRHGREEAAVPPLRAEPPEALGEHLSVVWRDGADHDSRLVPQRADHLAGGAFGNSTSRLSLIRLRARRPSFRTRVHAAAASGSRRLSARRSSRETCICE